MELSQVLGWVATVIFSAMLIPQIVKTIKVRSTEGVSISLFIMYLIGNFVAITYATLIHQVPLIIKYNIAILSTIFYITLFYSIRRQERKKN